LKERQRECMRILHQDIASNTHDVSYENAPNEENEFQEHTPIEMMNALNVENLFQENIPIEMMNAPNVENEFQENTRIEFNALNVENEIQEYAPIEIQEHVPNSPLVPNFIMNHSHLTNLIHLMYAMHHCLHLLQ
jgi:hypothetical protein